jgi:hypothetical protein
VRRPWGRRRGKRVAVLFHERQTPERDVHYAIYYLAELWRADGLEVVFLRGVDEFASADVVIVHVDLSVVPDEYLEFARRYPVAVNGELRDIRKSSFSTLRVARDSGYAGEVIVKSNLNYAGVPERVLGVSSEGEAELEHSTDYRIYDSVAEVPAHFFEGERFIVERFVPERDDGRYHVRTLEFVGDRHTSLRASAEHHVVSDETQIDYEQVEPPPALFELRRRLRLDYGKFDYVVHGSTVTVLDVNKTMGASVGIPGDALQAMRRHRAVGIYSYLTTP